jgi:hypothetical protein
VNASAFERWREDGMSSASSVWRLRAVLSEGAVSFGRAAELDKDIDQRLKRLGKNMKMPGFRPGKVPAQIVRQQYGEQARNDALSEALGNMFSEAVASAVARRR